MRSPAAIFGQVLNAWDDRVRGQILLTYGCDQRPHLTRHLAEVEALRREFAEALGFRGTREICSECSRVSAVGFKVPDDVWLAAVPAGRENDILCIACFARFADRAYLQWDLDIQFSAVSKRSRREDDYPEPTAALGDTPESAPRAVQIHSPDWTLRLTQTQLDDAGDRPAMVAEFIEREVAAFDPLSPSPPLQRRWKNSCMFSGVVPIRDGTATCPSCGRVWRINSLCDLDRLQILEHRAPSGQLALDGDDRSSG